MAVRKYAKVTSVLPGPKSRELLSRWVDAEADKTGFQAPVAIKRGRGAMLEDVDGNMFIDWTSGVLVTNVGHCHPKLVSAVQEASTQILNVYEYCNEYRVKAAEKLVAAAPSYLNKCFLLSTGSEATDSAVRIMKRANEGYEVLSFYGAFHGRTMSTSSIGGLRKIKKGFGPATPGVIRAPFPYCYRCPFKSNPAKCGNMCIEFLDTVVNANSTGSLTGLITEPYLGTAGFIFPPKGWLKQLEKWAREKGILMTVDEVQSSYGRTGTMWAIEQEDITPDIITVGKGIGSGISVSALLMRQDVVDKAVGKGELGSTYGGNPISCAAVSAVLDIFEEDKILENVQQLSKIFAERLPKLIEKSNFVGDVRGRGLMWGIELVEDKESKIPGCSYAKKLVGLCAQKGLLIGTVGEYGNVIRVGPPLVINEEQAHESIDIMEEAIAQL